MKKNLEHILRGTLEECFKEGSLKEVPLPDYVIEVPNNPEHGHFATNLPMTLAASQKKPPREIAGILLDHLQDTGKVLEKVEIAGPGFINFTLTRREWCSIVYQVMESDGGYGRSTMGQGEKVLMEFVSANPTGPLHLGHGRGAALGDALCRILAHTGHDVVSEFYINDAGLQIRYLGESIYARWMQRTDSEYPFPQDGYHGGYVAELAEEISKEVDLGGLEKEEAVLRCAEMGKERMLREIKLDLTQFRTPFDVWTSESELHRSGLLETSLEQIREKGLVYEKDGATWIKTQEYGDDKDRVIRKGDGQYTYFASDICYHLEKWRRGFTRAVNVWGADHHGYVQRVKAALKTNGIAEDWLSVLLIQLVKLWKGGQEIKMSKRAGQYVTLKELMEEVGVDAVRFVFLTKNHDSPIDFDIELVKKKDSDNPVYYVQYAHARICSIFRKAASEGISLPDVPGDISSYLLLEEEMALVRLMAEFPPLLEEISRNLEPHRLTYYLTELASAFHRYFNVGTKKAECRIVTEDRDVSHARLLLADAVRRVLAIGLDLMGIHAPERM